jgi:phosphopantetheinyl transferase (holo-ACP synthase)
MTRPITKIHNVETNEVIEREMNDAEFAQYQADQEVAEIKKAEAAAKEAARQALLDKLGITAEEAQLLLGGK